MASETARVQLQLDGSTHIVQAAWGDGGGLTGAWKLFLRDHRLAFLRQLDQSKQGTEDVLEWTLLIGAEDDSLATHSVVDMPVKSYIKRVDSMVNEFCARDLPKVLEALTSDTSDEEKAVAIGRAVEAFLFTVRGYKIAKMQTVVDSDMYSPYRIYMHNVIPQVQGSPNSLAVVLTGFLQRLKARGDLPADLNVILTRMAGVESLPYVQLASEAVDPDCVNMTPKQTVKEMLTTLKMGYWPWEWIPGSGNGFLPAARAAAGVDGRYGKTRIQGSFAPVMGRPFGDVTQATNAAERLVLLDSDPIEQRDYGILMFHQGNYPEALMMFEAYKASPAAMLGAGDLALAALQGPATTEEEAELLEDIILDLQQKIAEAAFVAPDADKPAPLL